MRTCTCLDIIKLRKWRSRWTDANLSKLCKYYMKRLHLNIAYKGSKNETCILKYHKSSTRNTTKENCE
jgi:hypothetical protein